MKKQQVYLILSKATQSAVDVFPTKEEAQKQVICLEQDDKQNKNYKKNNYFVTLHTMGKEIDYDLEIEKYYKPENYSKEE